MQRRELFGFLSSPFKEGGKSSNDTPLRPPYYSDLDAFSTECIKCDGKCAALCQEHIIVIAEDKTPELDFSKSGCTYCDKCATACEFGVLKLEDKKLIDAKITIDEITCLSWIGVMCFSCKDPCLEDAIAFPAMFMAKIDETKCTSCGFCISRCPTDAIDVKVVV